MIDMLKNAKNLENCKALGTPGFFVSECNISVEILDKYNFINRKPRNLDLFKKIEKIITLVCTCAAMA